MSDFKDKMHQIICWLRLRPDPAGEKIWTKILWQNGAIFTYFSEKF